MSDTDLLTRLDAHEGAFHEWADAVEMTTTDPELTKHRASSYRKAADLLREAAAEILRLRAAEAGGHICGSSCPKYDEVESK